MFNSNGYSLADVAAATGNNRNDGMWGDGGWWIILLFLVFGWGGYGFGGGFGGGNAVAGMTPWATQADVRAAVDQQTLISKIDQQTYGMADSFNSLNNTLNNNFRTIDSAICTLGYQNQQGFNEIAHQISDCCCTTQRAIDGVNYNMATQSNAIQNAMCNNTRDVIDNANANSRAILDFLVNDKLTTLQSENQNLKLAASQAEQNQYLVSQLRPSPIPAYTVMNPYCCGTGYTTYSNNGCGGCC